VGKGAELGILIRSGEVLERVKRLTTVVFDKTGTLTRGKPALTQVVPMARQSREQVLQLAASLEHGSEHPLAAALLEACRAEGLALLPAQDFQAQVGEGVQAVVGGQSLWLGSRALAGHFCPSWRRRSNGLCNSWKQLATP
jgi:Cu+-exporting ATPase